MKKQLIFLNLLMFLTVYSFAQRIELTPFAGYQLGGKRGYVQGDFKIINNANFGGNLGVIFQRGSGIEFSYSFMPTKGEWRPDYLYEKELPFASFDMGVHYFQLAFIKELPLGIVRPYGLFSVGGTLFDFKDKTIDNGLSFSAAAGGGLKIMFSRLIGIRIQGRILLPFYTTGFGLYAGTGGVGLTTSSNVSIVQGDFTGGLVFAFGSNKK